MVTPLHSQIGKTCLRNAKLPLEGLDSRRVFLHADVVMLDFRDSVTLPGLAQGSPDLSFLIDGHLRPCREKGLRVFCEGGLSEFTP